MAGFKPDQNARAHARPSQLVRGMGVAREETKSPRSREVRSNCYVALTSKVYGVSWMTSVRPITGDGSPSLDQRSLS